MSAAPADLLLGASAALAGCGAGILLGIICGLAMGRKIWCEPGADLEPTAYSEPDDDFEEDPYGHFDDDDFRAPPAAAGVERTSGP